MDALENLKETILKEYPRLTGKDKFCFECGKNLSCFNRCCADVNIFLTPYDVLRMRTAVGLGSAEFLAQYTLVPFDKSQHLPTPLLCMSDSEEKQCRFVDPVNGCTIYGDRPWPCRMYPLGKASPGELAGDDSQPFYFVMKEDVCKGHERTRQWTVDGWEEDQGVAEYAEFGELFKEITLHPALAKGVTISPQQIEMYWIALYDLDKFRDFIFNSSFLRRFDLTGENLEALRADDTALLRFGFKWVRLALFGEKTVTILPEAANIVSRSQSTVMNDA